MPLSRPLDVRHTTANVAGRATHSKTRGPNESAADPDTSTGDGQNFRTYSARPTPDSRYWWARGRNGETLTGCLTTKKPAGQMGVPRWWQVRDSNLRRHKPTDLQSFARSVMTCGFVARPQTSPRIPHDRRRTIGDSWTQPDSPDNRRGPRAARAAQPARSLLSNVPGRAAGLTNGLTTAPPRHMQVSDRFGVPRPYGAQIARHAPCFRITRVTNEPRSSRWRRSLLPRTPRRQVLRACSIWPEVIGRGCQVIPILCRALQQSGAESDIGAPPRSPRRRQFREVLLPAASAPQACVDTSCVQTSSIQRPRPALR
jgi:hypothetical protein